MCQGERPAAAGYYACATTVRVGRPSNTSELLDLVQQYSHIKGVGVGHSWWKESFCSGTDANAINIVLTELQDTLAV